MDRTFLVILIC